MDESLEVITSDPDCEYEKTLNFSISDLEPRVATPSILGNIKPAKDFGGRPAQRAELGSHGGTHLEDFRQTVKILKGRKLTPEVKFNAVSSNRETSEWCLRKGTVETFH